MREDLIFELSGSLEDEIVFTVVPRELYRKYRGKYNIYIISSRKVLWERNKFIEGIIPSHKDSIKVPGTAEYLKSHPKKASTHILQLQLNIVEELIDDISGLSLTEFRPHLRLNLNHAVGNPELSRRKEHTPYWVIHTDKEAANNSSSWDPRRWNNVVTFLNNGKYKLDVLQLSADQTKPCLKVKSASNLRDLDLETSLWLIQHSHGVITTDYIFPHLAAALGRPCIVIAGNSRDYQHRSYADDIIEGWYENKNSSYIELVRTLMPQDYITGKPCNNTGGSCGRTLLSGGLACDSIVEPDTYSGPTIVLSSCIDSITDKEIIELVVGYEKAMEEVGYNEVDLAIQEIFKEV